MNRNFKIFPAIGLVSLMCCATPVFADDAAPKSQTQVTVDLSNLDSDTQHHVLDAIAADKVSNNVTPDNMKKWADTGKGIGDAIAAAAKALNTGVNDFIKTPAGILTVWTILAYLFGGTLLHVIFGPIIWVILGCVIWRSATIFLRPNKRILKDGTVIDKTFVWDSREAKTACGVAHVVAFGALSLAMLLIIFS